MLGGEGGKEERDKRTLEMASRQAMGNRGSGLRRRDPGVAPRGRATTGAGGGRGRVIGGVQLSKSGEGRGTGWAWAVLSLWRRPPGLGRPGRAQRVA